MPETPYRAVIFDLGGVVLGSPLHAIAAFEQRHSIPNNTINRWVARSAPDGAWHRLERGELSMGSEFYRDFDQELEALGHSVSSEEMMARVSEISKPRPEMLKAIKRLRAANFTVAALTNNWSAEDTAREVDESNGYRRSDLKQCFDLFFESAVLGMRKPDPRIYHHTCEQLGVTFQEAIFLDDIGTNLKAARALGMHTIKVDDPRTAIAEIEQLLGLSLSS